LDYLIPDLFVVEVLLSGEKAFWWNNVRICAQAPNSQQNLAATT
jgi:hypothetical protein